jgi:hypothetical protein
MEIPKQQIIDLLKQQGKHDEAGQADQNLPDPVDHEQHADLLQQHGVDPQDLLGGAKEKFGL